MSLEVLSKEFDFYIEHQQEYVDKYNGKVIVLKGGELLGVYDSEFEALQETAKKYEPGTFLVQRVSPGPEAYTITISTPYALTSG
jgi:hypothetical protein